MCSYRHFFTSTFKKCTLYCQSKSFTQNYIDYYVCTVGDPTLKCCIIVHKIYIKIPDMMPYNPI